MMNRKETMMRYQSKFTDNADKTEIIKVSNGVTQIQIRSKEDIGSGNMTCYEVMPGITVSYNDFNMSKIKSAYFPKGEVFAVDYCYEGRIEQEITPGVFRYLKTKDIRLDNRQNHATYFYFPLSHYHGISFFFEVIKADESIRQIMPDFPVTIDEIRNRYCTKDTCSYLRNEESVEHILEELYQVPEKIKKQYLILKVMELLLCLWSLEKPDLTEPVSYYRKSQTEKVKKIAEWMTKDFQKHHTIKELSAKFDISPTSLKAAFKGIYGKPIYTYLLEKKMERAADLIRDGNRSITEVASEVGYESPSKFSVAFKKVMNFTPMKFKNQVYQVKEINKEEKEVD